LNVALKVERIGLRVLAVTGGLLIDLLTLMPRALLTPGRFIYNKFVPFEEHPLIKENIVGKINDRVKIVIRIISDDGELPMKLINNREYHYQIPVKQQPLLNYKFEQFRSSNSQFYSSPRRRVKMEEINY
jgi:hypothetical protein